MSDTVKEKSKWSKKKKITVIVLSVLCALIVLVVIAGVSALNWYCKTDEYNVFSAAYDVTLIAHRGMRSVAPENTAAAFKEAGENGYWGTECDIYRTADGVWVVSHDVNTYRMMDKTASVEKSTLEELMEMTVDNGSNIDIYPNLKICTLEEYLQICKEYSMTAVIELKGENNTEYYNEIVDMVKKYQVEAVYISFHIENLRAVRELTDDQVYFLTQKITEEDIELAKSIENCGIDFNANKKKNFKSGMLDKCKEENIKLGAWTVNDSEVLGELVNNDVTLITTDCIKKL